MSCPFCKIEEKDEVGKGFISRAQVIFEDSSYVIFYNLKPAFVGHCLLTPKKHTEDYRELSETELKEMAILMRKATAAIAKAYNTDSFNVVLQQGEVSGQSLPHLHWHIIPRTPRDKEEWFDKIDNPALRLVDIEETKRNVDLIKRAWGELYGG